MIKFIDTTKLRTRDFICGLSSEWEQTFSLWTQTFLCFECIASHGRKKMASQKLMNEKRIVSFINELKERKVLRVAVAYIVVTWIVIQVVRPPLKP